MLLRMHTQTHVLCRTAQSNHALLVRNTHTQTPTHKAARTHVYTPTHINLPPAERVSRIQSEFRQDTHTHTPTYTRLRTNRSFEPCSCLLGTLKQTQCHTHTHSHTHPYTHTHAHKDERTRRTILLFVQDLICTFATWTTTRTQTHTRTTHSMGCYIVLLLSQPQKT